MADENWKNKILDAIPFSAGLIVSFLIAFYIRTVPKASVFLSNGFVCFGGNDPWYHLRNVGSILHNFPHMLWFDAYTLYPTGTHQIFAPLYDMFLAAVIWIVGLGNPNQDLINTMCAYYPAVLGALVVIPTYFAAKWLFDRRVGLLAAILIAIAPGQFLSRSMIGFNDHHIAETLLTTIISMFLIMTLKVLEEHPLTFENIKKMDYEALKPSLPYIILTGLALGSYSLAWYGAVFFCFVIGVYITVQYIVDHLHSRSTDYLAIMGMIVFGIALVMVLMVPELSSRGIILKGLIGGIIAFPLFSLISIELNKRNINKYYYPLSITALSIVVVAFAKIFSQSIYELITSLASYFVRTGGGLTIAEASPLLLKGGVFSLSPIWYNFGLTGILSFVALIILAYIAIYKHNNREQTFLIVWSLMIIWAMLQQNRFAYYYSVNAAILTAYLGIKVLDLAGWKDISSPTKDTGNIRNWFRQIKSVHIMSLILVVLVLAYPSYNLSTQQNQGTGGPNGYWIEAMTWLNSSTPDPGLDYYENYEMPGSGELYPYPETAYGVMSWWDYGHWIEVIGHRIPNANPFQQGIGGRRDSIEEENKPGASTFFTAQSEKEATAVLEAVHPDPDKAGARYVVSDIEMASILSGKFYAMAAWTLDTADYIAGVQTDQGVQTIPGERYYNSMEARLHIFDGNGLKQYRMVHETPASSSTEEVYDKYIYNLLYSGNVPEVYSGYVKIFEYVDGATIQGEAPDGEKVTISTTILTSTGRTFQYSQSTVSNGTFEFIVPYSTEGPITRETRFDTMPAGPYTVSYGNVTQTVDIPEAAVIDGEIIHL